jgi:hypothetical protein
MRKIILVLSSLIICSAMNLNLFAQIQEVNISVSGMY